jgi:hypothetical protein
MFKVDEMTAAAIRQAYLAGGELAGVVELRRHYPALRDDELALMYMRAIVGWRRASKKRTLRRRRKASDISG